MRFCSQCLMPETAESLSFDENGVCSVCRQIEHKNNAVDWTERARDLDILISEVRGKHDYDCIVPFSGGKDSTFTLWYLVKVKKLKCLVVRFDHGFMRPGVQNNNDRTFRLLGVDVHQFTPNWQVVRKLMLESLKRRGDFCWHCHTGIFAYPMWVALKWQIPLVMWGEKGGEYSSYYKHFDEEIEHDERRFNLKVNLGINAPDMYGMLCDAWPEADIDPRDLKPYTFPPQAELRRARIRSRFLGHYVPWDVKKHVQIIERELGWQGAEVEGVPPEFNYEKIECYMQGVRDYLKFLKRGFGRTAHLVSIDIRNGRMSRDVGEQLVRENDGKRPAALDHFLEFLDIDEEAFHEIVEPHVVAPHVKPGCEACQANRANRVPADVATWRPVYGITEKDLPGQR